MRSMFTLLLGVAIGALAVSLILTPVLVHAAGAAGGALALAAVSVVGVVGSLVALAPLVGLPLGAGAMKALGAATTAAALAVLAASDHGWRVGVALGLYASLVLVLRPAPAGLARRLLRGALGAPLPAPDRSRP